MITKRRLVWKLSAVVVAILAAAITLSGYLTNLIRATTPWSRPGRRCGSIPSRSSRASAN